MAEEQSKSSGGGGSRRRRRRRPSNKRRRSNQQKNKESQPSQSSGKSGGREPSRSSRNRRRRKSRSRKSSGQQAKQRDMLDAKLPESVFVYTHVLRSSSLDTYGFRPDPFLNNSRQLGDFRIDLTTLFPDAETEDNRQRPIFDSALHGPIDTHIQSDSAEDEPVDEDEDNDPSAAHADSQSPEQNVE